MHFFYRQFRLLIVYIVSFTLIYTPTLVFAAGAPQKSVLWEIIEATPKKTNILDDVVDATNLNDVVEATGRKLDYDRTPVDNKVYKARVNPRIPATKAAIGSNAMKKLLHVSGWGYAAVEGVKLLLQGIDWVMDPAAQSIWRYKKQFDGDQVSGCIEGYEFRFSATTSNPWFSCPLAAVNSGLDDMNKRYPNTKYEFSRWQVSPAQAIANKDGSATFVIKATTDGRVSETPNYRIYYRKIAEVESEKEYLTEDALADYMLGTHKDFKDDKYKSKLPKENTWTGVAQQFKPENKFEEENSPTVKIAQKELDNAQPESEDTSVKPTPKPDGSPDGFKLPSFCSWATPVCDFIAWYKKDDLPDKDDSDLENEDTTVLQKKDIAWVGKCPENKTILFELAGRTEEITVLNFEAVCNFAPLVKTVVIFGASLESLYILAGIRRSGNNENE